jgi:predicted membrane protein
MNDTEIPELDAKGLRKFGLTTGAIVAGLFGLFFPWIMDKSIPVWPWVILAILLIWSLVAPASLGPVYRVWMKFGLLLSGVMTPLIMGILFYLLFTPIATLMRLAGRDPLRRRFDATARSYRIESEKISRNDLERPF